MVCLVWAESAAEQVVAGSVAEGRRLEEEEGARRVGVVGVVGVMMGAGEALAYREVQ